MLFLPDKILHSISPGGAKADASRYPTCFFHILRQPIHWDDHRQMTHVHKIPSISQYSSGSKSVVADRSASVMIQNFVLVSLS